MEIEIENLGTDDTTSMNRWHAKRNELVAQLFDDGRRGHLWKQGDDLNRDATDDEQMRWIAWRLQKDAEKRDSSKSLASADADFYEAVTSCMKAARDDERKRIASAIGNGLKALLGDSFSAIMYDIANEHKINIGYDW